MFLNNPLEKLEMSESAQDDEGELTEAAPAEAVPRGSTLHAGPVIQVAPVGPAAPAPETPILNPVSSAHVIHPPLALDDAPLGEDSDAGDASAEPIDIENIVSSEDQGGDMAEGDADDGDGEGDDEDKQRRRRTRRPYSFQQRLKDRDK